MCALFFPRTSWRFDSMLSAFKCQFYSSSGRITECAALAALRFSFVFRSVDDIGGVNNQSPNHSNNNQMLSVLNDLLIRQINKRYHSFHFRLSFRCIVIGRWAESKEHHFFDNRRSKWTDTADKGKNQFTLLCIFVLLLVKREGKSCLPSPQHLHQQRRSDSRI